jgi:hypothetical protein
MQPSLRAVLANVVGVTHSSHQKYKILTLPPPQKANQLIDFCPLDQFNFVSSINQKKLLFSWLMYSSLLLAKQPRRTVGRINTCIKTASHHP